MLRGVFFDLDNTLIRNRETQRGALAAAWETTFGSPCSLDDATLQKVVTDAYRTGFGFGTPGYAELAHLSLGELYRRIGSDVLTRLGLHDADRVERLSRATADAEREALALCPGAIETLDALRSAGLRLGLITNGASAVQRAKLTALTLADWFDVIVIDTEFGCPKPDRRIFDHAATAVGLLPAELLFVGDGLIPDVGGSRAAGWMSVWYNPRGELLPPDMAAPHHTVSRLVDLLALPEVAAALRC
jgi:HAD superfamily hydrolase (TIGR01549 family)